MAEFTVRLAAPAHEMAREEILKQAPFLSGEISGVRFSADGASLSFAAPESRGPELAARLETLARGIQRSLRSLQRKVVFRSAEMDNPRFHPAAEIPGVRFLGTGQAALEGVPLRLFRYFDRVFEASGAIYGAQPLITPTLIPAHVLARCDYLRSFPQYVTFASHLKGEVDVIDDFRRRHESAPGLDERALADMETPRACLSPAVCYHVYHLLENRTVPTSVSAYGVCGKCFRFESANLSDLRRLWDFTMREIVFLGGRAEVLAARESAIEWMSGFLRDHCLAAEIRTASDPFFIAPDAAAKTYFQLTSDAKFEVSALLPGGERLAVASHNYHSDFFGRVFHIETELGGPMHSVCVGLGLERWVHAFIQQHGDDPACWPEPVRRAPEFASA